MDTFYLKWNDNLIRWNDDFLKITKTSYSPDPTLETFLKHFWTLDETGVDEVGDADFDIPASCFTTDRPGTNTNTQCFLDSSTTVFLSDASIIYLTGMNKDWTLSFWAKGNKALAEINKVIFEIDTSTTALDRKRLFFGSPAAGSNLNARVDGFGGLLYYAELSGNNAWGHMVMTFLDNSVYGYFNNVLQWAETADAVRYFPNETPFRLGGSNKSFKLANISIYDKYFTAQDVSTVYNLERK
jgi:hypothetical protein